MAALIGAIAKAAGWDWAALLILYFISASIVSRLGAAKKEARVESVVDKGGERDAVQVFANGGVFALGALGWILAPHPRWQLLAVGALAASSADTWGTELGTWLGRRPRLLGVGPSIPVGMSGGVTLSGLLGSAAGALLIAALSTI